MVVDQADRGGAGVAGAVVAGSFDPVGVVAGPFDDSRVGPVPARGLRCFLRVMPANPNAAAFSSVSGASHSNPSIAISPHGPRNAPAVSSSATATATPANSPFTGSYPSRWCAWVIPPEVHAPGLLPVRVDTRTLPRGAVLLARSAAPSTSLMDSAGWPRRTGRGCSRCPSAAATAQGKRTTAVMAASQRGGRTAGRSKRANSAGSVNKEMRLRCVAVVARTTTANGW